MYEQYLRDPASVGDEWRQLFDNGKVAELPVIPTSREEVLRETGKGKGEREAAEAPAIPLSPVPIPQGLTPITGPAARLVQNMTDSLAVPTATSFREITVDVLDARRRELTAQLAAAGKKISYTHLIGYAIARAARELPVMTHAFRDVEGKPHRFDPRAVNLGLAVDVEKKDGSHALVVPVIKHAEGMDFATFHATYETLVDKARTNKLVPDDFAGATITLTNPGTIGTVASVPRLMKGQGSIIATGAIRPIGGAEGEGTTSTFTYDHRIIQGAESGNFLRRLDGLLQGDDNFYGAVFESIGLGAGSREQGAIRAAAPPAPSSRLPAPDELKQVAAAMALVKAIRNFGHLAARLDPLGSDPPGDPALDPGPLGLTPEIMARVPADLLRIYVPGRTLAEAYPKLQETYCGTIAYEVEHIGGLPYETIFAEFEGGRHVEGTLTPEGGTGDVKYHHGADGVYQTAAGKPVNITLTPNPSHLEAVNPVVEGRARANQTNRRGKDAIHDGSVALPVLIHGDASFAAHGVVAETFNLARLKGYTTGGTIHLIANNQLGFTTDPKEGRSTDYSSDLAKGFDAPIIHVNADDAEACLAAARLAMLYRDKFHGDVVIDVVGYRRWGHNEGDEPAYTQPVMYERIRQTPTARQRYADQLAREGVLDAAAAAAEAEQVYQRLTDVQQSLKANLREAGAGAR